MSGCHRENYLDKLTQQQQQQFRKETQSTFYRYTHHQKSRAYDMRTQNFSGSCLTLVLQRMYGEIIFKPSKMKVFVIAKATVDLVQVVLKLLWKFRTALNMLFSVRFFKFCEAAFLAPYCMSLTKNTEFSLTIF